MTEVTKDTTIGEILDADRGTAKFFLDMGMHCLGCPPRAARASSRRVWFTVWMWKSSWPTSTPIWQKNKATPWSCRRTPYPSRG